MERPASMYAVAVIEAGSLVGEMLISLLEERNFPISKLYLLAADPSEASTFLFRGSPLRVENLAEFDFSKVQIAFFASAEQLSSQYAMKATQVGCTVIDSSASFRLREEVPLVVPEVNLQILANYKSCQLVANPNSAVIQLAVVLKPIYDAVGIERINVCTYQAVSGTGKEAVEELAQQTARLLNGQPARHKVYPKQIAFNVFPQIGEYQENGYTKEEMQLVSELRKILADEAIQVNPTCVQVPVFYGHSAAVHIETRKKINAQQARRLLQKAPGVKVVDTSVTAGYPTPVTDSAGEDAVWVGRIREDISHPRGLSLWVVSDNVRKGAALNSVQIAEELAKSHLN